MNNTDYCQGLYEAAERLVKHQALMKDGASVNMRAFTWAEEREQLIAELWEAMEGKPSVSKKTTATD